MAVTPSRMPAPGAVTSTELHPYSLPLIRAGMSVSLCRHNGGVDEAHGRRDELGVPERDDAQVDRHLVRRQDVLVALDRDDQIDGVVAQRGEHLRAHGPLDGDGVAL